MNETISKIESLERSIDSQLKKSKKALIAVVIVYVVLLVFVIGYTTFIVEYIKAVAKPPVVAEFIVGNVQAQVPKLTDNIKKNSDQYGSLLAGQTISYMRSFIPVLTDLAKVQLDKTALIINTEMNQRYLPILNDYFKLNKDQINQMFNNMTDEQIATQMNNMMFEKLDKNVELLNGPIGDSINDLRERIERLANTPNSQMNNQELAQKRIIAYWIYLLKYQKLTGFEDFKLKLN